MQVHIYIFFGKFIAFAQSSTYHQKVPPGALRFKIGFFQSDFRFFCLG